MVSAAPRIAGARRGRARGPPRLQPLLCALLCAAACQRAAPDAGPGPRWAPALPRLRRPPLYPALRGGGCGGGGCGGGGCGSSACAPRGSESPEPDWALEDGPGDLLDAESTPPPPTPPPPPHERDLQLAAAEQQQQALVLAERREKRELAKQDVKRRAEVSVATNSVDTLVTYFVTTWLQIQLQSCWRPIFDALQSDIRLENELGPLTQKDLRRVVQSGLEIFDEDLFELQVVDLKEAPGYVAPSEEEVDRRVARYMSLDTNGDGVIDLQEFSVRFMSYCREAMLESADDSFRSAYERDPLFVEEDLSLKLMEFDERLQNDVRPILKLIDTALWPLRTDEERAAAMISHTPFDSLSLHDIIEVARPWDTLVDVGEQCRRLQAPLHALPCVPRRAERCVLRSQGRTDGPMCAQPRRPRLDAGSLERLS